MSGQLTMSATRHNASTTSSERKRLRDRRAQQNLRDKRENRIKALEERVAYCDKNHGDELIRNCMITVDYVRRENEILLARQEHLRRLFYGWEKEGYGTTGLPHLTRPPTTQSFPASMVASYGLGSDAMDATLTNAEAQVISSWPVPPMDPGSAHLATPDLSSSPTRLSDNPSLIADLPALPCLLPARSRLPVPPQILLNNWTRWITLANNVINTPPLPSPLDLLHGSRRNWLADQVNRLLRIYTLREPDRLAYSWILYGFIKWRINPTPLARSYLPTFLQPLAEQVRQGQKNQIMFFVWPQIKLNLLEHWDTIDKVELYKDAASSCKVRWPSSNSIWDWDRDDNILIKPEFFQTFMNPHGWGLASGFIDKYPQLMKGLDVEAVRFDDP
ncbi:hypothetical protein BDV28DRAFT_41766 [Aspergillus coremiiformis]|uniref:BZIP domain-containing protein n=1 Tax=Aspergillus coremiiformis TaxID=138285 RepID=A0A5N6ZI27_9EURO|nr:hypothetical protein BDV28DRAFT_41766 [Aspergillus coremiiformis]